MYIYIYNHCHNYNSNVIIRAIELPVGQELCGGAEGRAAQHPELRMYVCVYVYIITYIYIYSIM